MKIEELTDQQKAALKVHVVDGSVQIEHPARDGKERWDPLVVAMVVAAAGIFGNLLVALANGYWERALERDKAHYGLILRSVNTEGDRYAAARNLRFLVESNLISDPELRSGITRFVDEE